MREDKNDLSVCETFILLTRLPQPQAIEGYLELKTCWDKELMTRGAALLSMPSRAKLKEIVLLAKKVSK
jgi:hypothetical protein